MSAETRRKGLVDRIVAAYWDFSGSARTLLADRPSEATILSFMLIAAIISYCGDIAAQSFARSGPWTDEELDVLSTQAAGRLLVAPLGLYLVSAIVGAIARGFGGVGGWYETRAVMAWSLLVAAPWTLAAQLIAGAIAAGGSVGDPSQAWLGFAATSPLLAIALYIWGACVAGAHGFSSPARVVFVAIALAGALAGLGVAVDWLLTAG